MTLKSPIKLSRVARREFKRVAAEMYWLQDSDSGLLAERCAVFDRLRQAEADVDGRGTLVAGHRGHQILNPSARYARQLLDQLARLDDRLARRRLRKTSPTADPPPAWATGPEPSHGWAVEEALCWRQEEFHAHHPEIAQKNREAHAAHLKSRELYPEMWADLDAANEKRFAYLKRTGETQ
jgi:hypothetical protein